MLWRGGAPKTLGAPATMTPRDVSVVVLSLLSLFPPAMPEHITLPVPLGDALRLCDQPAYAADLCRFTAHLLDFAGDQDQRAELLDAMAERMKTRVEPIVGEISQGAKRAQDALEFKAGDVCWIEEEGAVGVVVPWAVPDSGGTVCRSRTTGRLLTGFGLLFQRPPRAKSPRARPTSSFVASCSSPARSSPCSRYL